MSLEYNKNSYIFSLILICSFIFGGITWWCIKNINEYNLQGDPMLLKLKKILEPIHPEIKNLKLYKGDKSYTLNKNKIYLCLKDQNGQYYNTNMLIYVFLHEFSHYLNKEDIGHTPRFYQIYEDLLYKAHQLGIYDPSIPPVINYCGYTQ